MRDQSPGSKPFRSFSQHGAILELLNPVYDMHRPTRVIPRAVITKPILLPHTPLHVRVRRAIAKEMNDQEAAALAEAESEKKEVVQPLGRVIHTPRQDLPPPPGTYSPRYDYLMPRSCSVVMIKSSKMDMVGDTYTTRPNLSPSFCRSPNHRAPKVLPPIRQPGLSWTLQAKRGPLFDTTMGATEGRFAAIPKSTLVKKNGGRFDAASERGELFERKQYMPDYSPSYAKVSSYPIKYPPSDFLP